MKTLNIEEEPFSCTEFYSGYYDGLEFTLTVNRSEMFSYTSIVDAVTWCDKEPEGDIKLIEQEIINYFNLQKPD